MQDPIQTLERLGFHPANMGVGGTRGYRHPGLGLRGTVYVGAGFVLAVGGYAKLLRNWSEPSDIQYGYPVWRNDDLQRVLLELSQHVEERGMVPVGETGAPTDDLVR